MLTRTLKSQRTTLTAMQDISKVEVPTLAPNLTDILLTLGVANIFGPLYFPLVHPP